MQMLPIPSILICFFCFFSVASLYSQSGVTEKDTIKNTLYPYNVGNIAFDPQTDNPEFEVCNEQEALPYNTRCGMFIEGEKYRVLQYFSENYKRPQEEGQTGYFTIRFLVNCQGKTDRFRLYEMGMDFQPIQFNPEITRQLLKLTKELTGWKTVASTKTVHTGGLPVASASEHPEVYDYYQYITFKLKNGIIETLLP